MARNTADILREKIARFQEERDWALKQATNSTSVDACNSYYFQVSYCEKQIEKLQRQLELVEAGWGSITA